MTLRHLWVLFFLWTVFYNFFLFLLLFLLLLFLLLTLLSYLSCKKIIRFLCHLDKIIYLFSLFQTLIKLRIYIRLLINCKKFFCLRIFLYKLISLNQKIILFNAKYLLPIFSLIISTN